MAGFPLLRAANAEGYADAASILGGPGYVSQGGSSRGTIPPGAMPGSGSLAGNDLAFLSDGDGRGPILTPGAPLASARVNMAQSAGGVFIQNVPGSDIVVGDDIAHLGDYSGGAVPWRFARGRQAVIYPSGPSLAPGGVAVGQDITHEDAELKLSEEESDMYLQRLNGKAMALLPGSIYSMHRSVAALLAEEGMPAGMTPGETELIMQLGDAGAPTSTHRAALRKLEEPSLKHARRFVMRHHVR